MTRPPYPSKKNAAWIVGGMLVVLAVSGYFMGLQQTSSHISLARTLDQPSEPPTYRTVQATNAVAGIVNYSQVDRKRIGPNAGFGSHLQLLVNLRSTTNTTIAPTSEQRTEALRQRQSRRAFDGAPPVVPHPIPQDSTAACLACHGEGKAIKDRVAPKISHTHYGNCTQCHVPAETGTRIQFDSPLLAALTENSFTGLLNSTQGGRAGPGAPPTIPHSTLMRNDCNSCHGPTGLFGLRTPHTDRQSCTQCHVPNAELDQRQFVGRIGP